MYAVYAIILSLLLLLPRWHLSTPLKVWCAAWAVSWGAHAVLAHVYYVSEQTLFFVFLGNVSFVLGGAFYCVTPGAGSGSLDSRQRAISSYLAGEAYRNRLCYFFLVLSFASIVYGASQVGGGIVSAISGGLFETMRLGKAALYEGDEYAIPSGIKLATAMTSITSVLAGLALASRGLTNVRLGRAFFVLYGASLLLLSAVSGVRSFILTGGLFFLFSYISAKTFLNHGRNVVSKKAIINSVLCVLAFLVWAVIVQSARLQDSSFQDVAGTLEHLRPWFGGYLPALSVWYDDNHNLLEREYGAYLFRGVLAPLGLVSGEGFNERVYFSWIGNGQQSNAMTIFRAIWADFGPLGGAVFCFLWGAVSSFVFESAMNKGKHWLVLFAGNYCAVFFSINYWFFAYGAKILAIVVAAVAVYCSVRLPVRFLWARKNGQ